MVIKFVETAISFVEIIAVNTEAFIPVLQATAIIVGMGGDTTTDGNRRLYR